MTINYEDSNSFYYVIKQHGIVNNQVQRYSIIANDTEGIRIEDSEFTMTTKNAIKDNVIEDGYIRKL